MDVIGRSEQRLADVRRADNAERFLGTCEMRHPWYRQGLHYNFCPRCGKDITTKEEQDQR
jgi:hypothetical protein